MRVGLAHVVSAGHPEVSRRNRQLMSLTHHLPHPRAPVRIPPPAGLSPAEQSEAEGEEMAWACSRPELPSAQPGSLAESGLGQLAGPSWQAGPESEAEHRGAGIQRLILLLLQAVGSPGQ